MSSIIQYINNTSKKKQWLIFIGMIAVSLLIVMIPFIVRGVALVWNGMAHDGVTQSVTMLEYIKDNGWLSAIGGFDHYSGFGGDYLTNYTFYSLFDPFLILMYIFPFNDMYIVYTIIMLCKFIVAAIAMYILLRSKKVNAANGMMLAIIYMISGYCAYTLVRHLNLSSGVIYLPFIIMGMDKIFHHKNPLLFVCMITLSLINSFYMCFFICVFAFFYTIVLYTSECRDMNIKGSFLGFFKRCYPLALYLLLGITIGAFVLIPSAYELFIETARSDSKGMEWYTLEYFTVVLSSMFLGGYGWPYVGNMMNYVIFIMLIYILCKPNKSLKSHKILIVGLFIALLIPHISYAMNLFNYVSQRWAFVLSFSIILMLGLYSTLPKSAIDEKAVNRTYKYSTAFIGITLIFALLQLMVYSTYVDILWLKVVFFTALSIGIVLVLYFGIKLFIKVNPGQWVKKKNFAFSKVLAIGMILTIASTTFYYSWYSAEFDDGTAYASLTTQAEQYVSELNEEEYFRTDIVSQDAWFDNYMNRGLNNDYYSTTRYNSISDNDIYQYYLYNEIYNPPQDLGTAGLNSRMALQQVLSVQYVLSDYDLGYGYTAVDGYEGLYSFDNYSSLGAMYEYNININDWLDMNSIDRQYAMLVASITDMPTTYEYQSIVQELSYDMKINEQDGEYHYTIDKNDIITITVDDTANKEIYFRLVNSEDQSDDIILNISNGELSYEYYRITENRLLYNHNNGVNICFGNIDDDNMTFTLDLTDGEYVAFEDIEIYGVDIDDIQTYMDIFSSLDNMTDVNVTSNEISGNISVENDGILYIAISNTSGMTAYVDGEQCEIIDTNVAFIGINLTAGEHNIYISYETPYLRVSIILSIIALSIFIIIEIIYLLIYIKRRRLKS